MELLKEFACLKKTKLVYQKNINVDRNYQESIEDYLDDLFKIVKCSSHSFITSYDIYDGCVTISGKTQICLIYQNNQNQLFYTDFIEEFDEKIEVKNLSDSAFASGKINEKYCSFRVVNHRKIDLHTSFEIELCVYDVTSHPMVKKCDNAKLKIKTVKASNVIGCNVSKFDFDESFALNNGDKLNKVLSYSANISSLEIKCIKDKVLVKSKVDILFVYCDSDGNIKNASFSFNSSKIFDISGVNESSIVFVNYKEGSMFVKDYDYNNVDNNVIQIYGDFYCYLTIVEETNDELVTDGYILNCNSSCNYDTYMFIDDYSLKNKEDKLKLKLKVNDKISKVFCVEVKQNKIKISNNKIILKLSCDILYLNGESVLQYNNFTNDFEICSCDYKELLDTFEIINYDYNIVDDDSISINIFYSYSYLNCKNKKTNILSDINFESEKKNCCAVSLYFGKKDEDLWNIAKMFSSDIEIIKSQNMLKTDVLDSNKVIIVPGL